MRTILIDMHSFDSLDWILFAVLACSAGVGVVEYLLGARHLAKATWLWTSVIGIFFFVGLFVR